MTSSQRDTVVTNYLLDTSAVSEWVEPQPNPGLVEWLDSVDEDRTYLSVVTLAELEYGVDRLPEGFRKKQLARWLTVDLPDRFERRVLPVDDEVARAWRRARARSEAAGKLIPPVDGFIAATAESRQLGLVTRNGKDFETSGVQIVDPWTR